MSASQNSAPTPTEQPPVDWPSVESRLGLRLPEDYKRLTATYDPGRFANYLWVYDPRHTSVHVNLVGPATERIREQMRSDHARGIYPSPVSPELLLPCGATDNGEYLFWVTTPGTTRTPGRSPSTRHADHAGSPTTAT
ncbi:SMI1/KNR4 family protein [Streptomyces nogalater]